MSSMSTVFAMPPTGNSPLPDPRSTPNTPLDMAAIARFEESLQQIASFGSAARISCRPGHGSAFTVVTGALGAHATMALAMALERLKEPIEALPRSKLLDLSMELHFQNGEVFLEANLWSNAFSWTAGPSVGERREIAAFFRDLQDRLLLIRDNCPEGPDLRRFRIVRESDSGATIVTWLNATTPKEAAFARACLSRRHIEPDLDLNDILEICELLPRSTWA